MKNNVKKGGRLTEYLEGFLSVLLGIVAGIGIAIGFAVKLILRTMLYLILNLTALCIPPLRYRIRMYWLLRDADKAKNGRLRTGLFRTAELKGGETDRLFLQMKEAMRTFKKQKKRRSEIRDKTEIQPVFERIDRLYLSFLKQFYLAADTINWNNTDIYRISSHPAIPNLQKAAKSMEILLQEHEKTLSGAMSLENGMGDPEQELAFIQSFNAVQANPELPPEQHERQQTEQR